MESPPSNSHETENVAIMFGPDWMNEILMAQRLAEQTTNLRTVQNGEVTCEALHLALKTLQVDAAWHAGVMNAEVAMEDLHRAIGRAVRWSSVGVGQDEVRDIS